MSYLTTFEELKRGTIASVDRCLAGIGYNWKIKFSRSSRGEVGVVFNVLNWFEIWNTAYNLRLRITSTTCDIYPSEAKR